jgi:hypothetical protein
MGANFLAGGHTRLFSVEEEECRRNRQIYLGRLAVGRGE